MADILAILVTHREFRQFDWAALPPSKTVLDFKGVLKASHSN
jgi:UDP-N-acetyl-D-mannosaminuronate dehydrogenase